MNLALAGDPECFPMAMMGIVVLFVVAGAWRGAVVTKRRTALFAQLANQWGGRVVDGGFLTQPRLEFRSDGIPGEVSFHAGSKNQSPWTRVRFDWPSERRLRISPQGLATWLRSIFGGAEIEVGEPRFDAACWIESTDAAWTRGLLTPEIRRRILATPGFSLDAGPGGLTVRVARLLVDDRAALENLVDLAILILREARRIPASAGVVLADVQIAAGSDCPVCGHPVDRPRLCPRCGTPHHDDCWTYMGGCAIFACESRPVSGHGRRVRTV